MNNDWKSTLPKGADVRRAQELLEATPMGRKVLEGKQPEKPDHEKTPVERWKGKK